MASQSPLFRILTPFLQPFRKNVSSSILQQTSRTFSSTAVQAKGQRVQTDPRITLIRYHLQHPKTPRPLRLSRLRALRHWTIHRAWMLAKRKRIQQRNEELYRMYQSMQATCEELRNLDPPEAKDSGRLYRIAMEKKGVFRHGGIPIEYARPQVDTPGKEAWNHSWTR